VVTTTQHGAGHLKEKAIEEFRLYWIVFAYLALMFGAFTTYRRLVLSEVGISYGHYGIGIIEAAVIAKVILIGEAFHLGKRIENHALIIAVLVKSVLFGLLVGVFNVLERVIEGLIHGDSWAGIAHRVVVYGPRESLARAVVMIVSFIPFFALWEVARVLGPGKLHEMFWHRRPV
jgi:hypothetical protein